ncbi:co-chaperone DjlA [Luminiphilus sp.]|nr:co-chaperone DjlA [Luminiphilus sp.]
MNRIIGKCIAGTMGFLAFGPAGLLFGLVLGHAFDRGLWRALQLSGPEAVPMMRAQFFETSFTLLGFVAKADGRVSEAEVAQTESLFTQLRLTALQRRNAIEHFKAGSSSGFDPAPTVARFTQCLGPRRQAQHTLMAFLIGIALADGTFSEAEREALYQVAALLSLPQREVDQLISMANAQAQFQERYSSQSDYRRSGQSSATNALHTAYAALGLQTDATSSEIKRRYRKLMSENHPDKLIAEGVPDELLRVGTERAQEITAAYEVIRESRGLK